MHWAWAVVMTAMLPVLRVGIRRRTGFNRRIGHCRSCDYNLAGNTSGVCPECGTEFGGGEGKVGMRRRIFDFASAGSVLLLAVTAVFWIASESRSWKDSIGIGGRVRFATAGGSFAFFNQSQPFFNGTISVSARGAISPAWPREVSFHLPGLHFRHFTWPGVFPGGTYWTLGISFLYPLGVFAVLPGVWGVWWLRRRDGRGLCSVCFYDLRGNTSGICPERGKGVG